MPKFLSHPLGNRLIRLSRTLFQVRLHEHLLFIAYDELGKHAQSLRSRSGIFSIRFNQGDQVRFNLIHEIILTLSAGISRRISDTQSARNPPA